MCDEGFDGHRRFGGERFFRVVAPVSLNSKGSQLCSLFPWIIITTHSQAAYGLNHV